MSFSKVMFNQPLNKIMPRLPEKRTSNAPAQLNNTSRPSKTNKDNSFQTNSKPNNTSGLEIRHFLNILNITDDNPKNNGLKTYSKSPIRNATPSVGQNTGSITNRSPLAKKHSLDHSLSQNKTFTNRSFISHPAASLNTINEDSSLLGPLINPPSPTFFNPSQSIQSRKVSNEGYKSSNVKHAKEYSYCKSTRNSIIAGLSESNSSIKPPIEKRTPTKTLDSSMKARNINQSEIKNKQVVSKSKESSVFQKKSSLNSSMCSMQSQSGAESMRYTTRTEETKQGYNVNSKSPISMKSKRASCDMTYQEEFNMKPLLEEVLDFSEKVNLSQHTVRKDNRGYENSINTSFSKVTSHPRNLYSDLLNKKLGGVAQKVNMFEPTTNKSSTKNKRNVVGSVTEISECTILDMLLNNTSTTMAHPDKKKSNTQGTHKKVNSVQFGNQKQLTKEVSLEVMTKIPKGILVNKSIERKPVTERIVKDNSCQQEQSKTESVKSERRNSSLLADTLRSNNQYERKESGLSIERSDDSCSILQSPLPVELDEEKKSKSLTTLRRNSHVSETKKEETIVQAPNPLIPTRGRSNGGCVFERSASMRRATKEEQMDGTSVKVRKENKEFVELLNKMSKNSHHMDEIQTLFGKDEQSLVKDLIEYIQTEKLTIGRNRSGSYQKKMTVLEKKIEEVRSKIPSLQTLSFFEENKEDASPQQKIPSIDERLKLMSQNSSRMGYNNNRQTKRSSFSLEASRRTTSNADPASVTDSQDPSQFTPMLGALAVERTPSTQKHSNNTQEESKSVDNTEGIKHKLAHPTFNLDQDEDLPDIEKQESTETAVDAPAAASSTVYTQESTSPSLLTLALDTPPGKEIGTLSLLNAVTNPEPKQEAQLTVSNIEPAMGSSLLSSVLSGTSNNKPAAPAVIVVSAPTNDSNEQPSATKAPTANVQENSLLQPTLQRNSFIGGSFGCLPQAAEIQNSNQEAAPKFGGLASLTFKAPQPLSQPESTGTQAHISISTIVKIKKKLKPVYIEKLNPENLKETVYGGILEKEHPGVSFGDLHDLFENAPVNKPAPTAQQQPKKELKSLIIDAKRAQNISIMAMKFRKLSLKEFREAIINLDPAILTSDTCSTLLPFCPLPDEIKACQNCKEPLEKLDTASQFLMHIYDIPQFGARLRSLIFKNEFKERLDVVLSSINKVKVGCDILKDNVHFRVFLRLSLEVANTLNEGTARGSALGLKPASLLSFDTVRSNKPGLTLLVYMAQKIYEQKPEILDFTTEFTGITDAAKVNLTDSIRSLQDLKKELNQLRLQLDISMEKDPPDSGFVNAFKGFYDGAVPLLAEAEEKSNKTNEDYIETAKFLGEDDESLKKKTSIEFFKVFKHLADTIDKFKIDEGEKRKREARRAAMKK